MKIFLFTSFLVVATLAASFASAAPTCTKWMLQTDGSYFRTCVGDDGKQYCEQSKSGTVSRVSCK